MKRLNIFFAIVAASLLAACSNDLATDLELDNQLAPISITAELPTTRAGINATTFSEGDQIGLVLPAYGTRYQNVPTEWTGGRLNTESVMVGSEPTLVYAYYPYRATDAALGFSVVDVEAQENLLYGVSQSTVSNRQPETHIQFHHAMARLTLNVNYKQGARLTEVQLVGDTIYRHALMMFTDGNVMLAPIVDSLATAESPLRVRPVGLSTDKMQQTDVLLLPDNGGKSKLTFVYDNGKSFEFDVRLPLLTMGQQYTLNVYINEDPYNGHEYVDLGLPSGLLWATTNVGADEPGDAGNFAPWSETDWANSAWQGVWRTPTRMEMQELLTNCDWKWENGGFSVVSLNNGKSIFLPAAGLQDTEDVLTNQGVYGFYLTTTLDEANVYVLTFYNQPWGKASYMSVVPQNYGFSVRPVAPKVVQ